MRPAVKGADEGESDYLLSRLPSGSEPGFRLVENCEAVLLVDPKTGVSLVGREITEDARRLRLDSATKVSDQIVD